MLTSSVPTLLHRAESGLKTVLSFTCKQSPSSKMSFYFEGGESTAWVVKRFVVASELVLYSAGSLPCK